MQTTPSSPANPVLVSIPWSVPVAVGHDVECITYATGKSGLLSSESRYILLTDHSTGIEYSPRSDMTATAKFGVAAAPWTAPDARVIGHVRGKVVRCLVEGWGPLEACARTFLWIGAGAPAYR